jgi:hypothetical protein
MLSSGGARTIGFVGEAAAVLAGCLALDDDDDGGAAAASPSIAAGALTLLLPPTLPAHRRTG